MNTIPGKTARKVNFPVHLTEMSKANKRNTETKKHMDWQNDYVCHAVNE